MTHAQSAGKSLDNLIANVINEMTTGAVRAHSTRGSGNTAYPEVDVLVRTPREDVALESKRTSVGTGEYAYVLDDEDVRQLTAVQNDYTDAVVLVKFTNREPLLFPFPATGLDGLESWMIPDCFDAHVTDSGTLRLTKPDTSEWNSAQSGRSLKTVLMDELALNEWRVEP